MEPEVEPEPELDPLPDPEPVDPPSDKLPSEPLPESDESPEPLPEPESDPAFDPDPDDPLEPLDEEPEFVPDPSELEPEPDCPSDWSLLVESFEESLDASSFEPEEPEESPLPAESPDAAPPLSVDALGAEMMGAVFVPTPSPADTA